jgi:PAS domain-containing protein
MNSLQPIVLSHTWPLWEQPRQFELGYILNSAVTDLLQPPQVGELGLHHVGCWECDLEDDSLIWSGGVYDIFGLPRGARVTREEAVGFYCEASRAIMEHLRSYSIKHRRGFTVDVEIRPAVGANRWVRLMAAPVCDGEQAVRLHGLKVAI